MTTTEDELDQIEREIQDALRRLEDYKRRAAQRSVEDLPPAERRKLWRVI